MDGTQLPDFEMPHAGSRLQDSVPAGGPDHGPPLAIRADQVDGEAQDNRIARRQQQPSVWPQAAAKLEANKPRPTTAQHGG